jgi:16S rRNA (adenine1518-N6/adenine1519-N6)-dimethyltransferase
MKRNSRTGIGCNSELFRQIVKGTFNQRRKKLRNSIQQIVGKESPLLADPILDKRPEQLSIDDFTELTNKVEHHLA